MSFWNDDGLRFWEQAGLGKAADLITEGQHRHMAEYVRYDSIQHVDYIRLQIYRMGPWIWQVHENQSYLGRLILRLERPETGSVSVCTTDEWLSLHESIRAYEGFLSQLFSPDRFNYSQMGNIFPQLHVQVVPRYKSERVWQHSIFGDAKWGHNWAPTPRSPLTLQQTYDLAAWLQSEIRTRITQ